MLIEVINNIFKDNCYSVSTICHKLPGYDVRLAVPNDKKRQEYFLLVEYDAPSKETLESLVVKDADYLFNLLSASKDADETFRKNCTMILCCKNLNIESGGILTVEEDPYNFKKNVIIYSPVELKSWVNQKIENLSISALNELINGEKGEFFRLFKEGANSDDFYSLLMKIVTKVPIIHYLPAEKDLYDLEAEIKKYLTENDREILDFIAGVDLGKSEELIEEILLGEWKVAHE